MELVELNKICDLKNGYAFKSSDYVESSNTLNCRMSNIRPQGYFDVDYAPKYLPDAYAETFKDYLLEDGDLVIAMTDMANDPKILGVPTIVETHGKSMLLNQRVGKLEIIAPELIHVPFLQYSLNRKSVKKYYTKFAGGGLQLNVGKKQILSVKIPLPPLDQQKKIAAILDIADNYRQKTKALIEKYEELTQSLFLQMFGDHLNGDKKPLKELVKFSQGQQFGVELQRLEPQNGYARFLRIVDFTQGDDLRYVPNQSEKYYVQSDDIVIVRYGASAGFVGTNKEGVLANNLFKVNYDRTIFHQLFLYHIFQHGRFIAFIEKEAFGAAMPALSFKVMERFEIPVPAIELQNQFAERIQAIEAQKAQAQASLAQAKDLFNSLLQRAFKGELAA